MLSCRSELNRQTIRFRNALCKLFNPEIFRIRQSLRATYIRGQIRFSTSAVSLESAHVYLPLMPPALSDIQIARELASRLESVFGPCSWVVQFSKSGWLNESQKEPTKPISAELSETLESLDLRSDKPFVRRVQDKLVVLINVRTDALSPVIVGVVLPDQNDAVICSLLASQLESIQFREEAARTRKQSEFFIDQVTQDFEELTWLRTTNDFFDLCGAKHTIDSIATKCLPDLASVIRAESLILVQAAADGKTDYAKPDWNRVISASGSVDFPECFPRFLAESIPQLSRGPRVVNLKPNESHIADYSGLRNCIAISVSKGQRVYGWILAANKIASTNDSPYSATESNVPNPTQFGTFEAGLLCAAANIMSSHSRNVELFEAKESLLIGIVRAIINAIDAKDPYTCGHSERVASYSKRISARLGQSNDECERIYMAGLLHDVGKIGIPDSILGKTGALTNEEFAVVKKHPEIGYSILKHLKQLSYVLPGVLHHHEAVNGNGYPLGLCGEAIPLHGRILAVADAYDAMTSDRPYRPGMPSEKAVSILRNEAGKIWDVAIVDAFLECLANEEIKPRSSASSDKNPSRDDGANPHMNLMDQIANSINNLVVG